MHPQSGGLKKENNMIHQPRKQKKSNGIGLSGDDSAGGLEMDYHAIFDAVNEAIFVLDMNTGVVLDANTKLCEMYGYTHEEVLKIDISTESAGSVPHTKEDAVRWVEKAANEGPQLFEWLAKDKSGRLFWVEINLKIAAIGDKRFGLAVVRDITERRSIEQELYATKDYLRTVFSKIHDALFVFDPMGKVIDVNEKVLQLYRCTREEALGVHILHDFSAPDPSLLAHHQNVLWKEVMDGHDQLFEWKARRPGDGSVFDVEVCLSKLSLPGGDFILASCRDITDRKKVELELRGTKEYLKTVLNNIRDATYIIDLYGNIRDVNDRMLEMHGCAREEAVGATIRDFSADDNPFDEMLCTNTKVIGGEDQYFEWKCKRPKDGSTIDVEVYLSKLSLPDGDFLLANVHDISERKGLDRELRTAKDYLGTVFNKIHDALFVHDFTGKVVDVNEKMLELYRISREEALGLYIIPDYSSPDNPLLDCTPDFWQKVMAGEDRLFEWKARRPGDGSTFDVEVCLSKLSLPQGDFVLASCRDITLRKGVEEMLIKEKEVFFSVMNDNPHGIALFDNSGKFVYFNPEFSAITGYTIDDVPNGRAWARKAYPDPEYRAKVVAFWRADKLPGGRGKDAEWRITCRDGELKDVEFRVTYLGDKSLAVLTDTTARNRAEEELRAEKQRFQVLSENSPMGMFMVGADDHIQYVNPKFKELFGYDLEDIPDLEHWFIRAYPDPSYRLQASSRRMHDLNSLGYGEGKPYVKAVTCRDGAQKYISFIPVKLEAGKMLLTCEDITQSKEAEDKIRERNLELEVLNDIIASVSGSLHLPEILETMRNVFVEKLMLPIGGIFFCEEPGDGLRMEMCWGVPDVMKPDFEAFALKEYTAGTVAWGNGVTLVKSHPYFWPSDNLLVYRFLNNWHRHLSIPLRVKGDIQGMFLLVDKESGILRDDQIGFFKTMVQQIGVAIQNARLFSQVRQSHAEMKALSLRLVRVQEAELRHVARELHDEIGQLLTALKLALGMALKSPGDQVARLAEAKSLANMLTGLVRELSRNLRPSMLDDLGLLPTLPWLFKRFSSQTNVGVVFEHSIIDNKRFPSEMETVIYRVVQEALTNVARHAGTDLATVRLWSNDRTLGVQIEDHGVGFDFPSTMKRGDSSGLNGMRERAMLLEGRFTVETIPGAGTRITVELPKDLGVHDE